jgi:hypothetical protein
MYQFAKYSHTADGVLGTEVSKQALVSGPFKVEIGSVGAEVQLVPAGPIE